MNARKFHNAYADQLFILFVIIAIPSLFIMLPSNPLSALPGRDSGVFLYAGRQILDGKIPYVDFWDHKGPLIYLINALGLFLGGKARHWGVWMGEYIILVLSIFMFYRVMIRHAGKFSSLVAVLFFMITIHFGGPYKYKEANFTETYSVFFNLAGLYFLSLSMQGGKRRKKNFALTGILFGLSILLRPNNSGSILSFLIVLFVYSLLKKDVTIALQAFFITTLGACAVLLVSVTYFYSRDALAGFIDAVFVYNYLYSKSGSNTVLGFIKITQYKWLFGFSIIFYFILMAQFIRLAAQKKKRFLEEREWVFMAFLLVGCVVEIASISISGRIYPHYLITCFPYIGWLAGFSIHIYLPGMDSASFTRRNWVAIQATVFVVLLLLCFPKEGQFADVIPRLLFERQQGIDVKNVVVDYVQANTVATDTVLVWGNDVWINFLANRMSPSRYMYQYPLFMAGYTNPDRVTAFLNELEVNPPKLIVGINDVDENEIVSFVSLMTYEFSPASEVSQEMILLSQYFKGRYCVRAVMKDAVIFQSTEHESLDAPCLALRAKP